jgi:hypothetical protein
MERRRDRQEYQNYAPGEAANGRVEGGRHINHKHPKVPHPPYPFGPAIIPLEKMIPTPPPPPPVLPPKSVALDTTRLQGIVVIVQGWGKKPKTVLVKERKTGQLWVVPKYCLQGITVDDIESAACESDQTTDRLVRMLDNDTNLVLDDYVRRIAELEHEVEVLRRHAGETQAAQELSVAAKTEATLPAGAPVKAESNPSVACAPSESALDQLKKKFNST